MISLACVDCGQAYPEQGVPFRCPQCGGLYDFAEPLRFDPLGPRPWDPGVTLGEGHTPLIEAQVFGRHLHFKCEYLNPTGSFKDRGTAALVSFLQGRGVTEALEDSSGNAGASFAAYAAHAGLRATIFAPASTSGPKLRQMEAYGAKLIRVPGPRSEASRAALGAARAGVVYASHAYLPLHLAGYALCAFEIVAQLGGAPSSVLVPAGQAGFLLGLGRGFQALLAAGAIERMPALIGIQAAACAPLHALWKTGRLEHLPAAASAAEGVLVAAPLRAEAAVEMVRRSAGRWLTVAEDRILPGRDALARMGFYVEPTSALVWSALEESLPQLPDPVVVVLTGSGLKS